MADREPQIWIRVGPAIGTWLMIGLALSTGAAAVEEPERDAAGKVRATMEAAVFGSPSAVLRQAVVDADAATVRGETGAGSPLLTWQSEGIGGGFEREANAVDYLRLSLPFNRPWRLDTVRDLRDEAEALRESGTRTTRLEVAVEAGLVWLDLAAATEEELLARARLDRLDHALVIQRRRYELGEISGSERTQIELQWAREAAAYRVAEARRFALHRQLEALVPTGLSVPADRDLEWLVESTKSSVELDLETVLATSPILKLSKSRTTISQLMAERKKSSAWGEPEVEVEWERVPGVAGLDSYDAFGFRLAYPLPFGKQGKQSIAASEYRARAAAAENNLVRQEVEARFLSALQAAESAEVALEALAPSLERIRATERSLTEQFRLGAISYLVYLDGFTRLDEVVRQAIATRHRLLSARLELAGLSGSDRFFPIPDVASEDPS